MSTVLPPPPPPRSGDSCWKWGGITCLVGCAGLLIVFVILAFILWPRINTFFQKTAQTVVQAQTAGQEMKTIWTAVEKYHTEKGKYPDNLESLTPKYLSKAQFRFTKQPGGPPYTYYKPAKDSPPDSTVLEYSGLTMTVGGTQVPMPLRLHKDGTLELNNRPIPTQGE